MSDLLHDIAQRLQNDYDFKPTTDGMFLRKGRCPGCSNKSLWTYAATPWVIRCERLNNCGYEAHAKELYNDLFESWSGREYTLRFVKRAREDGWKCEAAQIPQRRGVPKQDWNDLHQRDRLQEKHINEYLYHGALLIAESATDKALQIYHHTNRTEFDFDFGNRLYWFELNLAAYSKAKEDLEKAQEEGAKHMGEKEMRAKPLEQSTVLKPIANCLPRALYYQRNEVTQEAWYYFSIAQPHDNHPVKGTFTAGHLTAASEFKKQLLNLAPGAIYSGSSAQLERMMLRQLDNIKVVQTVDFVGYSKAHKTYLLGGFAVNGGNVYEANEEDYFEIGKLSIKSLQRSIALHINTDRESQDKSWPQHLWNAFGTSGYVALAFWFSSLFAEQVREEQMSFPFLEIVGEPGAGKTTLIQFLWKLFGRDYEGFDPSKSTASGRQRTFTQVSGLPIVLIESDRETKSGGSAHVKSFDWDELKDAYNGRSVRTTGVRTGGNETYEPPFRASIVISQNNQVQASQAIMERICHMTFTTKGHTKASFESAKKLETYEIEQLSGFLLACLKQEEHVLETFRIETEKATSWLLEQDGIYKPRIAKNHAQLMAGVQAMSKLMRISEDQFAAVRDQIVAMAQERQRSISADQPPSD